MKLKLDLHTHCFEWPGHQQVTLEAVERIVRHIRARGLDGIAITEHEDSTCGFAAKELVERHFPGQALIIPGQEKGGWPFQIVELYLPDGATFRFLAHPGWPEEFFSRGNHIHGIELDNPYHSFYIPRQKVMETAHQHNLLLLSNSDAHAPHDIGIYYNEISLEELSARARAT